MMSGRRVRAKLKPVPSTGKMAELASAVTLLTPKLVSTW
jgi:hypothetical protein